SPNAEPPRVFVKGNRIRFYFESETNIVRFDSSWSHVRVPADGYAVSAGRLEFDRSVAPPPDPKAGWREATVVAGPTWRSFATNLIEALTPMEPWHGVYYQAFFHDRVMYRDDKGLAHLAPQGEQPPNVVVDHRYPLEETLLILATQAEKYREARRPDDKLFLLMPPSVNRLTQPLLVDREKRQCVSFINAALYDSADRGLSFAATA